MRKYFQRLEGNEYLNLEILKATDRGDFGWFGTSLADMSLVEADFKVVALGSSASIASLGKRAEDINGTLTVPATSVDNMMQLDVNAQVQTRSQISIRYHSPSRKGPARVHETSSLLLQTPRTRMALANTN